MMAAKGHMFDMPYLAVMDTEKIFLLIEQWPDPTSRFDLAS